jgi:hypothetical protein
MKAFTVVLCIFSMNAFAQNLQECGIGYAENLTPDSYMRAAVRSCTSIPSNKSIISSLGSAAQLVTIKLYGDSLPIFAKFIPGDRVDLEGAPSLSFEGPGLLFFAKEVYGGMRANRLLNELFFTPTDRSDIEKLTQNPTREPSSTEREKIFTILETMYDRYMVNADSLAALGIDFIRNEAASVEFLKGIHIGESSALILTRLFVIFHYFKSL